jgi:outer membrane protein assembly factor BamB
VVWKQIAGAPAQASPLLVKDRLYIVSDGGIASCLNAKSGEIVWKERIGKDFAASPLFAAGRIYFFDCDGNTVVVEPGDQFKEIARNKLESGFMASPAVVGKALILRTKTHLYRIE